MVDLAPFGYATPPRSPPSLTTWQALSTNSGSCALSRACQATGEMPEYLFDRTHGVVGLLRRLIEDDCTDAITTGEERLTPSLLARATIRLRNLDDLDPGAC